MTCITRWAFPGEGGEQARYGGPMTTKVSLREKHAVETRQRIVQAAMALFVAQGYDATTVDEIAERADVSPRTFFRYFNTKDALLFHDFDEKMQRIQDFINRRPEGELPATSLVAVLCEMVDQARSTPEQRALIIRLLSERPSLRSYQRESIAGHGERLVTGALAERVGLPPDDLGMRALVATVSACFDVALQEWIVDGGVGPFEPRIRATMAAAAGALAPWATADA